MLSSYCSCVIEVSPVADAVEEQLSLDLYNAVVPWDRLGLAELHSFKAAVPDHVDLVVRVDGVPAGSGVAFTDVRRPDRAMVHTTVLPELRRRGAGTAFYEALSAWARERGLEILDGQVADDDPESLAFATRRGFVEERREKGVALDLTAIKAPVADPPAGVEIVTWADRPELARGMHEVSLEASADIPGDEDDEPQSFAHWLAHTMGGSGDKPEATFVALAGDDVIGYAKFSLTEAQPTTAHHDLTGVKRAWRGRGVARALKATQIAWAKANGYEQLRTRNEERNVPIRRLNEQFGYKPTVGRIYLRGPLA